MNWYIKTFRKRVAVKIIVVLEDHRVKEFWRIPKGDTVDIAGYGAFKIDPDNIHLSGKNIPTYYYDINNAEPLRLLVNETKTYMSPTRYQTALSSKATKVFMDSANPTAIDPQTIIIIVVMLVGFIGLGYYITEEIGKIYAILTTTT